jgi:hypothetical protein
MIENEYHYNWEDSKEKAREDLVKLHKAGKIFKKNGLETKIISKKKKELRKRLVK